MQNKGMKFYRRSAQRDIEFRLVNFECSEGKIRFRIFKSKIDIKMADKYG